MDRKINQVMISELLRSGKEKYNEHFALLKSLKNRSLDIRVLERAHHSAFEKVNCLDCANCCKTTPPIVTKKDSKRIAGFLGLPPKTFARKYLIDDLDGTSVMKTVPCQFLNEDNTCRIYSVRPEACRRYPHTDEKAYVHRPKLNADNTLICPAAVLVVEQIEQALS